MKNSRFIYSAVAVLVVGILLSTCKNPDVYVSIDQETKDYCLFGQGSYWIYQDSATFKNDSIIIENPIDYEQRSFGGGDNCYTGETYSTRILFYSQDSTYNFIISLTSRVDDYLPEGISVLCNDLKWGHATALYYHSGKVMESFPDGRKSLNLLEKKDNYSINGVAYSNVKIFEHNYLEEKRLYYWAKNIGLIRTEIHKEDSIIVKNLIRYNIKPYNQ